MAINQIAWIVLSLAVIIIILYLGYLIAKRIFMKKESKSGSVSVCPRCGSLSKSPAASPGMPGGGFPLFGIVARPAKYKCNNCGYEGIFPIVSKNKLEDFRKNIKKSGS